MSTPKRPLLSIVIPAYNRPKELRFGLYRFITQIVGCYETDIEIIVCDDCSPDASLDFVKDIEKRYGFVRYHLNPENIGLERNLIACTSQAKGEYLWIFGDDDFLEDGAALSRIMPLLAAGKHDVVVLNRTRRSFDLKTLISNNWMKLPAARTYEFTGLRHFCIEHGFISVIGFISVSIFKREAFINVDPSPYYGTMYPQLGAMLEAFHDRPVHLIGAPLICHRTQTQDEKRAALGNKKSEADFMSDAQVRNAKYFSHPYIAMLEKLTEVGAFKPSDIVLIPETTVIHGLLIDFLIQTVGLHRKLNLEASPEQLDVSRRFFGRLTLSRSQKSKLAAALPAAPASKLTFSVVTPSYNQGEFLDACLSSVRDQTHKPIEHFVFDPGSTDDSRAIASSFEHVTLIAEPDSGQSDALNKGFKKVTGDIIAWVNSDDLFADKTVFAKVAARFNAPDAPDIVYGKGIYINEHGKVLRDVYINKDPASLPHRFQHEDGILQPALFMRRSVVERVGPLRNDLHYSMDYEYWIRCVKAGMRFAFVDDVFALARYHTANKTYGMRDKSYAEVCEMMKEHFGYVNTIWLRRYAEYLADGHDGVLATAANAGTADHTVLEETLARLMLAYNGGYETAKLLEKNNDLPGYGDTHRAMHALNAAWPLPVKPIPLDKAQEPNHVCYTVGPRRWAFEKTWKQAEIERAHAFLKQRIKARRNDVCVIVGNGPSLNKTNLSLLEGQDVIVSNNAFLSPELSKYATYFTVVNYLVAEQSAHQINMLRGVHKVLPYWLAYCLNPGPDTYFVDAVGYAKFSTDMFKNMSWRHTVTFFNLHLAYGLGYRKVVLIGFDHSYKQATGVKEQQIIHSHEDDENHFNPAYFRGKKWQAADVDMMEEMYRLADDAFTADGRSIINATVGGKLELFPRQSLNEALMLEELSLRSGT